MIIILCTCPKKDSKRIAKALLINKLAACVNILPKGESYFIWKGKMEFAKEELLLIKTKNNMFNKVKDAIKKIHPYENPEVISITVSSSDKDYEKWVNETVKE